MDKRRELNYFEEWGFKNRANYEKYVKEQIEDLEFIAPQIFKIFKEKVIQWERDFLRNKRRRFVAKVISPPNEKLVKSPERIVDKILESWECYSKWEKQSKGKTGREETPKKHDPRDFLQTVADIVRFRIVCNYLSDVNHFGKKIEEFVKKSREIKLERMDDYIETPFPERRAGHRALQYIFKYFTDKRPILFEVQVMTQLQHAWDKKDHHLIYEYRRIRQDKNIPLYLRNRMAAMSEVLYVADNVFNSLRDEITRIMGEE